MGGKVAAVLKSIVCRYTLLSINLVLNFVFEYGIACLNEKQHGFIGNKKIILWYISYY